MVFKWFWKKPQYSTEVWNKNFSFQRWNRNCSEYRRAIYPPVDSDTSQPICSKCRVSSSSTKWNNLERECSWRARKHDTGQGESYLWWDRSIHGSDGNFVDVCCTIYILMTHYWPDWGNMVENVKANMLNRWIHRSGWQIHFFCFTSFH